MNSLSLRDQTTQEKYKLVASKYQFTKREAEILLLMVQGLTIEEVAEALFRSKKTIYNLLESCHKKANCKTQFSLAQIVINLISA